MTIFFPDLSNWEPNLNLVPGTQAVVAKATEGNYYKDASFTRFRDEAGQMGIPFSGYHFLISNIDPALQAAWYHSFAGNIPCMLDVETEGSSKPTVAQCLQFIDALSRLGGRCWGAYFPRWYWGQVGGDLGALERAGAVVVSSSYTTYTDQGPGWEPYGGATPAIWQYTSSQSYGGSPCDFNAFRGTQAELAALMTGTDMNPYDVWAFKNPNLDPIDMRQRLVNAEINAEATNAKLDKVLELLGKLSVGAGVDPAALAAAELDALKERL